MTTARGPRDRRGSAARPGRGAGSRRPGPRPGARAISGAGASAASSMRRAPAHVRRMLLLLALVVVMAVIVAPVLSGYLQQRAEITAAQDRLVTEQQQIDRLQGELKKWDDPDYVEQQARERLRFVKEGETAFTVIDDTGSDYTEALPGMAPVSDEVLADSPWYGQVWESVKIANEGLPEPTLP
ncbi:septum formation initiator family protein [Ornithinimicrobium avium]|nr:septum formation initiator family protein [Ornithinimicrobium avium]